MSFSKDQRLNEWVAMLDQIYGRTQNYGKTEYELYTHLLEVCGAFGKHLFKKGDLQKAEEFLPKMFAWAVALLKKVKGREADLEQILLTKFPRVCPYCAKSSCVCWERTGQKPELNDALLRNTYFANAAAQRRSVDDFQLMFRTIYEQSWQLPAGAAPSSVLPCLMKMYTRLIEETSEVAEAMRLSHLLPSNFDNELADYIAWWFALVSSLHRSSPSPSPMMLASDVLWQAYPGYCPMCSLTPCDCRPGPVRELLSKPALNDLTYIDALTQSLNRAAYDRDLLEHNQGRVPAATPISCVRIDVDKFKEVNNDYDHQVGDRALKHLVTLLRRKIRPRDRLYRVGGDEFALLCPDLSAQETAGMLGRVALALKEAPMPAKRRDGFDASITITVSVGVAECNRASEIYERFEAADHAAISAKNEGRDRVVVAPSKLEQSGVKP